MPVTLSDFASAQIAAQRLTVKEFARRAGLGLSHAYQILRGERPRAEGGTFDAVAKGLSMTPAEMAEAMGRGSTTADADEAAFVALFRRVPSEKRSAARDMLLGLTIQPTPRRVSNRHRDGASIPGSGGRRHLDPSTRSADDQGLSGGLPTVHNRHVFALARFSIANVLTDFKRLVGVDSGLSSAQPAVVG